jgi:hypothetical protein
LQEALALAGAFLLKEKNKKNPQQKKETRRPLFSISNLRVLIFKLLYLEIVNFGDQFL